MDATISASKTKINAEDLTSRSANHMIATCDFGFKVDRRSHCVYTLKAYKIDERLNDVYCTLY